MIEIILSLYINLHMSYNVLCSLFFEGNNMFSLNFLLGIVLTLISDSFMEILNPFILFS